MSLLAIIAATFVSEDLTCITVGLLIGRGRLSFALGLTGCYLGLLIGDLGLWALGRTFGASVLQWRVIHRRLTPDRIRNYEAFCERHIWKAVMAARFLPGARLPIYFTAGMFGRRPLRFLAAFAVACAIWTPLLVGGVALIGEPIVGPLESFVGGGWIGVLAAALVLVVLVRVGVRMATPAGRARLATALRRTWQWEFWPPWIFYLPLLPWIAFQSLRYRGLSTITAANPGIPHSGIVGESKYEILQRLPAEWIVGTVRIESGDVEPRWARLKDHVTANGWSFPLIFKPDVGERGAGVRLIRSLEAAHLYLEENEPAVLVQTYHLGPCEAGIFYYRLPGEPIGQIFSITDKRFPQVVGDGQSSAESLIRRHPRLRMQADKFLARLDGRADQVLAEGESLPLAVAGNHCQGTMFCDAAHLITPELERRIDEIARHFDGFFFGRFDVRYADAGEFRAGRGFKVIELNGASSESTNLYDPRRSLLWAYGVLYRQWALLFRIGAANRAAGHRTTRLPELVRLVRGYYRDRRVSLLSD